MALQYQRIYLKGAKHDITVILDYKNLTYFLITKVLNRRQARQAEVLINYNFKIIYYKGTENIQADALSRRADHKEEIKKPVPAILKIIKDKVIIYNQQNIRLAAISKIINNPL